MVEWIIGLVALAAMEIVLGIDNLVFITLASSRLPKSQQPLARKLGLALALVTRLALLWLLFSMVHGGEFFEKSRFELTSIGIPKAAIVKLSGAEESSSLHNVKEIKEGNATEKIVDEEHFAQANGMSIKDLILFLGGLFLIYSSIKEIHEAIGGEKHFEGGRSFMVVLLQIALFDVIFSLDSVITAVGMVDDLWVMVAAIILAVIVMIVFAEPVSNFVENNPTLKMLALSFLILIGVMLVAEGIGAHLDKGYIYFAMAFALLVEVLNIRIRKKAVEEEPVASVTA